MSYNYKALDHSDPQIRVLTLSPSEDLSADIHVFLETISFSRSQQDVPSYEALSYTWGSRTERKTIYLDDTPFEVTSNLDTALRYLRHASAPRVLWIDAICIDQNDIPERNHQVGQMSRTYSSASKVLIWLGGPDEVVEVAMKAINMIYTMKAIYSLSSKGAWNHDQRRAKIVKEMSSTLIPSYLDHGIPRGETLKHMIPGVLQMLQKPWWHRIWVIQELVLAANDPLVGCGTTWITWAAVDNVLNDIMMHMTKSDSSKVYKKDSSVISNLHSGVSLILLREQWREDEGKGADHSILKMVNKTRGYDTTEERDQIFAILGLVSDSEKAMASFSPDYELTTSEVYQKTMKTIFTSCGNLDFLGYIEADRRLDLPSWCADFSKKAYTERYNTASASTEYDRNAQTEIMDIAHYPKTGILKVAGTIIGKVGWCQRIYSGGLWGGKEGKEKETDPAHKSRKISSNDLVVEVMNKILSLTLLVYNALKLRCGEEEAVRRIAAGEVWRVLCNGEMIDAFVKQACFLFNIYIDGDDLPQDRLDLPQTYEAMERLARGAVPSWSEILHRHGIHLPNLDPIPDEMKVVVVATVRYLASLTMGNCLLFTGSNYFAHANNHVQQGDFLCSLFGCRDPVVLRPLGENTCQFVSTTYCGDKIDTADLDQFERVDFFLK